MADANAIAQLFARGTTTTASMPSPQLNQQGSIAPSGVQQAGTAPQTNRRPPSEFYLNIGLTIPVPQDDGTVKEMFVSLPGYGIAFDHIQPEPMSGGQGRQNLAAAKNLLLEALIGMKADMDRGQSTVVPALQVQLSRRQGEMDSAKTGENPLLAAMMARLNGNG